MQRELEVVAALRKHADYFVATVRNTGYALYAKNIKPLGEYVTGLD